MSINTYWWCFVAQLWFSPSTNDHRFLSAAARGGTMASLYLLIVFCALREPSVCLWQRSVGCRVMSASVNGREVCRCNHEPWEIHTPRKHLHLFFSEWDWFTFKKNFYNLQIYQQLKKVRFVQKLFFILGEFSSETNSASLFFKCCIFSKTWLAVLIYTMR